MCWRDSAHVTPDLRLLAGLCLALPGLAWALTPELAARIASGDSDDRIGAG
jgi:hypothetical protein